MGYRNELELRPHVGRHTFLMELIGNGRCWHFDAWMYEIGSDAMGDKMYYLHTETRAGGRDVLQANGYRLNLGSSAPLQYIWPLPSGQRREITLQDRGLAPEDRAALNALHWSHIRPMLQRRPDVYSSTSAAFHYIRAPSLVPLEGATNFFQYAPSKST